MQHCTMSSAISVRRSLTRISGKRPVKSASATVNTATFWNCRKASTCRSGSSPDSRSVRAASILEKPAREGSSSNAFASISSSSSSGKSAICRAKNPLIAHTSISRSNAAGCSLRSARYEERVPIASTTRNTRSTTVAGAVARGRLRKHSGENHVQTPVPRLVQAPVRCGMPISCSKSAATAAISPLGKPQLASSSEILRIVGIEPCHAAFHRGGDANPRRQTATPRIALPRRSRAAAMLRTGRGPIGKTHVHAQAGAIQLIVGQGVSSARRASSAARSRPCATPDTLGSARR